MSIEAQKCNQPNCKGFVVFENADFDFHNLEVGKSGFYEFSDPKCTECDKQYYVVPHYIVTAEPGEEPLTPACITEFDKRQRELKFEEEADPLTKIELYIQLRGYSYNAEDVLEGYSQRKQGYYISHTMKDCVAKLSDEIESLLLNNEEGIKTNK